MRKVINNNSLSHLDIERGVALGRLERSRAFHALWKAVRNSIR